MPDEIIDIQWDFYAFESSHEGRPIDAWWESLLDDHKYLIKDILSQLQVAPRSEWEAPFFDPLDGEGGISEIRFDRIECEKGTFYYRIYGVFEEEEVRYTFLHATNKRERNDKDGKSIAKRRLRELDANQATIYPVRLE